MARRQVQEINAGSMADIAFLLLIFFLVTTTMESDKGILRILPPMEEKKTDVEINQQNLLKVNINYKNDIRVSGISRTIDITELRSIAKRFILGENVRVDDPAIGGADMVPLEQAKVPYTWRYLPADFTITADHIIQLKNDRGTSYEKYLQVQNELTAAYREIRDDFCLKYIPDADTYDEVMDLNVRDEIEKEIYPRKISESDPVNNAQQ
ncbi:MAG: biopolymer transporter ExbD [Bacteroidales bacterium]|nr:biopolymer transporter ExbD [Bacteroidales bacterium]